jgi:hypothetical protein
MREDDANLLDEYQHVLHPTFKKTMETYVTMIGYIQRTTKELQRKSIALSRAQFFWIIWSTGLLTVAQWVEVIIGQVYISKDSTKLVAKHFHNGVQAGQLTSQEKAAVASLRKESKEMSSDASLPVVDADREEMIDPFDARVAKRMKVETEEELGDGFDCRLILGSAAEVERVRSMADKILQLPASVLVLLFLR